MKIKAGFFAVLLGVLLVLSGSGVQAAEFTLKVGYVVPESYPHHIAAVDVLKPYIEKESGGKISVELYPNGQLGGDRQLCEAIQLGSVEMAFPSTTVLASFIPELQLLDLPYLFSSKEQVYKVLDQNGSIGKLLAEKARSQGMHLLGFGDIGFMSLTNSQHPIKKPEDTKGLKIRVMENPVYIDTAKAIGFNPTPMTFGEVYTALQQKVVDGQEQGVNVTRNMKFAEVQKYLSLTEEAFSTISIIASESFLDELPDDLRSVVIEGVRLFCQAQRKVNSEQEVSNLKELEEKGMVINGLSDEERGLFVKATEPVRQKYAEKINPKLFEEIQLLIK